MPTEETTAPQVEPAEAPVNESSSDSNEPKDEGADQGKGKPEEKQDEQENPLESLPASWQDEIKALRQENAQRRTSQKELRAALEAAKTQEDIDAALKASEDRIAQLERDLAIEKHTAGLDPSLKEFVTGSTEEEIKASVEKVREAFKAATKASSVPQNPNPPSGGMSPGDSSLDNLSARELAARIRKSAGRR